MEQPPKHFSKKYFPIRKKILQVLFTKSFKRANESKHMKYIILK